MAKLLHRIQQKQFFQEREIRIQPSGMEKMSAVILEFAQPMLEHALNDDMRRNTIAFAIFAWNLAIYKGLGKDDSYQKLHDLVLSSYTDETRRQQFQHFLAALLERKRESFADNKRFIMDYELGFTDNNIRLNVVSTS